MSSYLAISSKCFSQRLLNQHHPYRFTLSSSISELVTILVAWNVVIDYHSQFHSSYPELKLIKPFVIGLFCYKELFDSRWNCCDWGYAWEYKTVSKLALLNIIRVNIFEKEELLVLFFVVVAYSLPFKLVENDLMGSWEIVWMKWLIAWFKAPITKFRAFS